VENGLKRNRELKNRTAATNIVTAIVGLTVVNSTFIILLSTCIRLTFRYFHAFTNASTLTASQNEHLLMRKRLFAGLCILFALFFSSCDPAIGVALQNKTATDKTIKVIYPANFKFPGDSGSSQYNFCLRDSVKTFDMADKDNYLHPFLVPMLAKDTIARTYSFVLKSGYSATVESRFLAALPTFGQIFIIDQTDTVELKRDGKDFVKKPKLLIGGSWTHSIKD